MLPRSRSWGARAAPGGRPFWVWAPGPAGRRSCREARRTVAVFVSNEAEKKKERERPEAVEGSGCVGEVGRVAEGAERPEGMCVFLVGVSQGEGGCHPGSFLLWSVLLRACSLFCGQVRWGGRDPGEGGWDSG